MNRGVPGPAVPMNMGVSGFAQYPWPTYSCYDPCPSGSPKIVGPYVPMPYTPYWRRVNFSVRGRVLSTDDVLNVCIPDAQHGKCKDWWLVRATGRDVIDEIEQGEDPDFPPFSSAPLNSMLKMEIVMKEYGGYQSSIVADIGSRLNVSMGPTDLLFGYILVPDVQRYLDEDRPVPAPFDTSNFAARSEIVPAAVKSSPIDFSARYTQSLFLTNDSDPPQGSITLDIPNAAKTLQVFQDDPSNPAPSVEYIFKAAIPNVHGRIVVDDTEGSHQVPQNATQVTVSIDGQSPPQIVTLVFLLGP